MKKFLCVFCALITAISLTACNIPDKPDSGSSDDVLNSSDTDSSDPGQSDNSGASDLSDTEGFVFVVNADNPVDTLTSDQICKIYSGEITNWSQVGGDDRAILPYQRNNDSGSQNYMTVFMGDTPLAKPETEFVIGGMAGIMDAVAVYDNSAENINKKYIDS